MKEVEFKNVKYFIGNNAQENWDLLDKSQKINQDYIWFHLNSFPSCYVIMYSTIKDLESLYSQNEIEEFLNYGANLCKENSKYSYLNDLKILYSPLKKIKKTEKVGEVIISGKRKTIKL
jgi:hypothetical protein